jgi:hypothetical protein
VYRVHYERIVSARGGGGERGGGGGNELGIRLSTHIAVKRRKRRRRRRRRRRRKVQDAEKHDANDAIITPRPALARSSELMVCCAYPPNSCPKVIGTASIM